MKHKFTILKSTFLLFFMVMISTTFGQTTRLVPSVYATIQAAIDASVDGDIIEVAANTTLSDQVVTIDKAITLKSASGDWQTTPSVIDGASSIYITASNAKLIGFIFDATTALAPGTPGAIFCYTGDGVEISNNKFSNIALSQVITVTATTNLLVDNNEFDTVVKGIFFNSNINSIVSNNTFTDISYGGILMDPVTTNITIEDNTFY